MTDIEWGCGMPMALRRDLISLAFLMHGLGMIGGVYFVFTTKSWFAALFGSASALARVVAGVLWIVSGIAFVAAAWGFMTTAVWWPTAALVAALLSLVGIVLWAGKVPAGTYVGAALDVAVIVYLLFLK